MEKPTVSIIMPSYNARDCISEAIQSVQAQSFGDWHLHVMDDASKDDTVAVIQELAAKDPRISVTALTKNNGAPAAPRNMGVREAKADWVAFLDADDMWHPEKLKRQLETLARFDGKFCCTRLTNFGDVSEITNDPIPEDAPVSEVTFWKLRLRSRIPTSSVLISRDLLLETPFDEDPSYHVVEDYHCWLRILEKGHLCYKIDAPFLNYRVSPGQISASKLKQIKRVYSVHSRYEKSSPFHAAFFTASHVTGALYSRLIRREM